MVTFVLSRPMVWDFVWVPCGRTWRSVRGADGVYVDVGEVSPWSWAA